MQLAVHDVESRGVDVEHRQRGVGHAAGDLAVGPHFREVAHAAQQAVDDARRAARTAGDLQRAFRIQHDVEQRGRALDDARQFFRAYRIRGAPRYRSGRAAGWSACPRAWWRRPA